MNKPFEYFEKIYVISARENEERRTYIKKVLSKLDIDYEFYDAVMGEELNDEEIRAVYDEEQAKNHKTYKRPLSKPEIGCALSHINIYKKIIAEDLDNALIFEDDIVPEYESLHQVQAAIKELPENWDLLHLGTLDHQDRAPLSFKLKLIFYYPFVALFSLKELDYAYWQLWNLYPHSYSKTLNEAGYHIGCHAYAMSKKGAEKFLNYHDKIVTPIDLMLSVMIVEGELHAYMTKERLFEQNKELESALEKARLQIRKKQKERKL